MTPVNEERSTRNSAAALIVAAGSSRRMGFDKLFADLAGAPVLRRTVDAFQRCDVIDTIVVVTSADHLDHIDAWRAACPKLIAPVEGGAERHLSVRRGLEALPRESGMVAVHDGARPLVTSAAIVASIDAARAHGAAACARPVTETVKRADAEGVVTEDVDRTGLWAMETPQTFDLALLNRAYDAVLADGITVTDEVSAIRHLGESIVLVDHGEPNIKITFPADLQLAETLFRSMNP